MDRKGQGAMEYLMTYGWAILVVIIVGVVLWQMGIFNPSGGAAPGMSGFTTAKPNEWSCVGSTGVVTVALINTGGQQISNLTMTGGTCAVGANPLSAGEATVCTTAGGYAGCSGITQGERFESTLTFTYDTQTGMSRSSTGTVWGPAE